MLEFSQHDLEENAERLFALTALNIPHKSRDWEGLRRYVRFLLSLLLALVEALRCALLPLCL